MDDYDNDACGQWFGDEPPARDARTDYDEWSEAVDALELDAYPDPRDLDLCVNGVHTFGTCCCSDPTPDDAPF